MPNCIVKGCKNCSTRDKKADGITYHAFPNRDQNMKEKWISVVRNSRNQPLWEPTSHSLICSAHFDSSDLYYTKKGLRRVMRTGYPKLLFEPSRNPPPEEQPGPSSAGLSNSTQDEYYVHDPLSMDNNKVKSEPLSPTGAVNLSQDPLSMDNNKVKSEPLSPTGAVNLSQQLFEPSSNPPPEKQPGPSSAGLPNRSLDEYHLHDPLLMENIVVKSEPLSSTGALKLSQSPTEDIKPFDTPEKYYMRRALKKKIILIDRQKKKIKTLNQKVRRLQNRNKSLKNKLKQVQDLKKMGSTSM